MRTPLPVGQVGPVGHVTQVRQSAPAKPEVESDDPFQAVAMQLPPIPGFDAMGEMARCMVEEYAMMGFSAEMLMKMFQNPFYQALHRVYEARGEEYVRGLLSSVFGRPDSSDRSDKSDESDRATSPPPPNGSAPQSAIRNPQSEIQGLGGSHA